jgi:hypothetical protein
MADLSQQLQLQQSINDAIKARNELLSKQNKLLSTQQELAGQFASSVGNERATRRVRNMSDAIRQGNEEMREGAATADELRTALDEAADAADNVGGGFSVLSTAVGALGSAVSGGLSATKALAGSLLNIAATASKAAVAIFSFPFKLFSSLVKLSQEGSGGAPIREAYEEVRETFGDLSTGTGKAVTKTFENIRSAGRQLGQTGLSVSKVFGYGRDGLAALLKDLNEQFAAAGDNISRLRKQFLAMGGNVIGFQRGLGMTKEEFAELANLSELRGKSIADSFTEFGSTAIQTAKRFGLDVKDMAKGMKELNLDVDNFGHLGPKAFAPITAYARKLGLEIKDMAGVMAKFSGFADTTEAASKLSQAFGLNIDSMQLMSAQNPAEKIDILRKSFFGAGKDLSKLNYQQRQYLTSLTGLQGKSLEAAFALDKQGISYSDIEAASEEANKQQMTQKEVMAELSKNIKRMVQVMSGRKFTGFFDAFAKGFETGIMRSGEFRGVLRDIRKSLRITFKLGRDVGRAFVKAFPGVKKMLGAIRDFFDPKRFQKFRDKALPIFKELFENRDFDKFFAKIKKLFSETVGDGSPEGSKFLQGFKEFMNAMTTIAGKAMAKLTGAILDGLILIGNLIANPTETIAKLKEGSSKVGDEFSKNMSNLFGPSLDVLTGEKGSALVDVFKKVFKKAGNWIKEEGYNLLVSGLTKLWEKIKEWWKSPAVVKMREDIWKALKDGLEWAWEKAKDWASENKMLAAGIFTLMFPGAAFYIARAATGVLTKGLSMAWAAAGGSQGIKTAAIKAMDFMVNRAGPALSNAGGRLLGFVRAGIGHAATAGRAIAGAASAHPIAAAVIAATVGTAIKAHEIYNDPQMRKAGVTLGESIGGGYLEAITFGHGNVLANFLGASTGPYSASEILKHNRKLADDAQRRMDIALRRDVIKQTENFGELNKEEMRIIAKAQKAGNQKEVDRLLQSNMDTRISQEYLKMINDPKVQKAFSAATPEMHDALIKMYKTTARMKVDETFDKKKILKQSKMLVDKEAEEKLRKQEAKAALLMRQATVTETLKKLANVPVELKAALAGIKNVDTDKIADDIAELAIKLEKVLYAVQPVMNTIDKFITTQGEFAKLATRLKSVDKISGTLNLVNIGKLPKLGPQIMRFTRSLARAAKGISDAEVKKIEPIVKAVSGFKGGKVEVKTNLPDKFDIHLNVSIDSRELGKEIISTRIAGTGADKKYVSIGNAAEGPTKANLPARS